MEDKNGENTQEVVGDTSESKAIVLYSPKAEDNLVVRGDPLPVLEMSWNADWAWTSRVHRLVVESARLKFLLAWSSTLGGAYSALGENVTANAKVAGLISCCQLTLAGRMGDDLLASRSKLYAAYSLLQRSHIHQAARIVRDQYQYISKDSPVKDKHLEATCLSIWKRLQHLYRMRKLRQLPSSSLITPYSISPLSSPQASPLPSPLSSPHSSTQASPLHSPLSSPHPSPQASPLHSPLSSPHPSLQASPLHSPLSSPHSFPQASPLHSNLSSPQTTTPSSPCHSPSPPLLSSPRTSFSSSLKNQ